MDDNHSITALFVIAIILTEVSHQHPTAHLEEALGVTSSVTWAGFRLEMIGDDGYPIGNSLKELWKVNILR